MEGIQNLKGSVAISDEEKRVHQRLPR
jgi:hypothetical protein